MNAQIEIPVGDEQESNQEEQDQVTVLELDGFKIKTNDHYNIDLFQSQMKEIVEGGGRGKGRGTPTGKFEMKDVFIGHYSSVRGAFIKMQDLLISASKDASGLKAIMDRLDSIAAKIGKDTIKKIYDQAKGDAEKDIEHKAVLAVLPKAPTEYNEHGSEIKKSRGMPKGGWKNRGK